MQGYILPYAPKLHKHAQKNEMNGSKCHILLDVILKASELKYIHI